MRIVYPSSFLDFSCLGGSCPLTCCVGWSVDIDRESLRRWKRLSGDEGKMIRDHLVRQPDGAWSFTVTQAGRCWFLDGDGLCRMQKKLGFDELCETCKRFPRLSWHAGSYLQFSMDLACPEAARMAFTRPFSLLEERRGGGVRLEEDRRRSLPVFLDKRKRLLSVLQRPDAVSRITTDGGSDRLIAQIVADCTRKSRVGFLTPRRVHEFHRIASSYWTAHQDQLVPWFSTFGSLLLFRYSALAWHGAGWGKVVRLTRRAMRLTYLLLLHQERAGETLDVEAMVAATVLFSRRIEHVEENLHLLITR